MKPEKDKEPEKEKETTKNKTDNWIEKAEEFIDETAEKIHQSDTYRKADQSAEKATKKLFRQAGKLWGKSERYFRKKTEDRETEDRSQETED
jgi:HEPN domain-containing protein